MLELDCRGMRCPKPIVELTKATRSLDKGTQIRIIADDPAFELDCLAWLTASGHEAVSVERQGQCFSAIIALGLCKKR